MDVQVRQFDLVQGSVILCNYRHTGTIHAVGLIHALIFNQWIICNLKIPDSNVLCIIQKNC